MKYIPSIAFEEMSGSAKGVTAAKTRGRKYIRKRRYGGSTRTEFQASVKSVFKQLSQSWKALSNARLSTSCFSSLRLGIVCQQPLHSLAASVLTWNKLAQSQAVPSSTASNSTSGENTSPKRSRCPSSPSAGESACRPGMESRCTTDRFNRRHTLA